MDNLRRNPPVRDKYNYVEGNSFEDRVVIKDSIEGMGELYIKLNENLFEDRFRYFVEVVESEDTDLSTDLQTITSVGEDELKEEIYVLKINLTDDKDKNILSDVVSLINDMDEFEAYYHGDGEDLFKGSSRRKPFCKVPQSLKNTTGYNDWNIIPEVWGAYDIIFQEIENEGEGRLFECVKAPDEVDIEVGEVFDWKNKNETTSEYDKEYGVQWVYLSGRIDDYYPVGPVIGDDDINRGGL